jgi:DNA polymerase-1
VNQYLNYKFVETQEDLNRIAIEEEFVGLDIETTRKFEKYGELEGLDPYTSQIIMIQIGTLEVQYIIDARKVNPTALLKRLNRKVIWVGHNLKFEYKHILHNYGVRLERVYDTMIVYEINHCGLKKPSSLAAVAKDLCNINVPKDVRLSFLTIRNTPFSKDQIEYGAKDIIVPFIIKHELDELTIKNELDKVVELEMEFLKVLGDIEYRGMAFDKDKWLEVARKSKEQYDLLEKELNEYVIKSDHLKFFKKQMDLFSTDIKVNISWTSSKQVIKYFRYLGFCPQAVSKTTKKLSYTVGAKELVKYHGKYKELVGKYLSFKEAEQAITTFGKDFLKYIHPITGRIHSDYKQILNTGRISSNNPNLQNIPADDHREAFVATLGYRIINADYSGQEQIILANKSQDVDLLYFYKNGLGDMHSFVASKIFKELAGLSVEEIKENHSDKRRKAKDGGFAINYGGVGITISNNLGISEEEGNEIYNSYFEAFPGLGEYFDKMRKVATEKPFILIDPITKRKSWFKDYDKIAESLQMAKNWSGNEGEKNPHWSTYFKTKSKLERNGLNYPIQGEAGSITKLAAIKFRQWTLDEALEDKIFLTNLVHDEINAEAAGNMAVTAKGELERCMKEAGDIWCKIVPLNAEAKIVDYWSH